MSHTDVHRPFWVQILDPGMRRFLRPWHHHWARSHWDEELKRHLVVRSVPCDLGQPDSSCTWSDMEAKFCGCWACSWQYSRRRTRRHERHTSRLQLTAARAAAAAGDLDIDIPRPGRNRKW